MYSEYEEQGIESIFLSLSSVELWTEITRYYRTPTDESGRPGDRYTVYGFASFARRPRRDCFGLTMLMNKGKCLEELPSDDGVSYMGYKRFYIYFDGVFLGRKELNEKIVLFNIMKSTINGICKKAFDDLEFLKSSSSFNVHISSGSYDFSIIRSIDAVLA